MARINELPSITVPEDSSVIVVTDTVSSKKITVSDFRAAVVKTATTTTHGTVKVGSGLRIDQTGTLSVSANFSDYTLPPATTISLGGVIIGAGLSVDSRGVISVNPIQVPRASTSTFGVVRIGSGFNVVDGVLSNAVSNYTLPSATSSVLGGIKVGTGLAITDSVLSVKKSFITESNQLVDRNYTTENNSNSYSVDSVSIDRAVTFTVERQSSWVIYSPLTVGATLQPSAIQESLSSILTNYVISNGRTATSYSPITVGSTATVEISPLSTWIIF